MKAGYPKSAAYAAGWPALRMLGGVLAISFTVAGSLQAASSACDAPSLPDRIESVSADGEIWLSALGLARIADVRLVAGEAGALALAWLRSLAGRPVFIAAGPPDRWRKHAAAVALADPAVPIDLGELLVAEGFAVVDIGEEDALCRLALLGLENLAREHRLGVWKNPDNLLIQADDVDGLDRKVGRFAIVEGRVISVGERPGRTYLNFGRAGTNAFTVTVPKRSWAMLRRRGISAQALRGRRVRARGIVEMWRAATIEIVAADMLEILDAAPAARR